MIVLGLLFHGCDNYALVSVIGKALTIYIFPMVRAAPMTLSNSVGMLLSYST
jgi:hypothetical protein